MKIIPLLIVSTFFMLSSSFSQQNEEIINIAKKVYKQPQFANIYRSYGDPKIFEMKTLDLPQERRNEIRNDPNNIWREATNGREFYVVQFHADVSVDTLFQQTYAAQVYVWKDNKKPFAIKSGVNRIMYPPSWNASGNNIPNPYDNKLYNVTYSSDVPLKQPNYRKP